jgi:hypothetical protein
LTVGSPFRECPRCRAPVSRPSTNEWTLLGPGEKAYWLADRFAKYLALGLLPALAYWAFAVRAGKGQPRILLVLLAGGPIFGLGFGLSSALHDIRRSRARMADPMYRARLMEFGRRSKR